MRGSHFLLAPDSFKGTMSSSEICSILERQILAVFPDALVRSVPVADGGEGTVEAFLAACGGRKITKTVQGPFGEKVDASYALIDQEKTAVVEMAACAGLPLTGDHPDPLRASTFGVGQLLLDALSYPIDKIILGLGGSATNDMGFGMCAALGARFLNSHGEVFIPAGGTLSDIAMIDIEKLPEKLRHIEKIAMCDITNPLYGPNGAAFVFGPQKGADEECVRFLDQGLRHAAECIQKTLSLSVDTLAGGGAAGGMGAGLSALLGFRLQMGIQTVLDTVHFERLLEDTDWVLTGEGRLDAQSLGGKVVIGIARRARGSGVPVLALVGDADEGSELCYAEGVTAVFPINRKAIPFSESRLRCREDLAATAGDLLRLLRADKGVEA